MPSPNSSNYQSRAFKVNETLAANQLHKEINHPKTQQGQEEIKANKIESMGTAHQIGRTEPEKD